MQKPLRLAALPAKLRPPLLNAAVARPRLHGWLDAQGAELIWLAGAPGAGKTTLAAAWLRERGMATIWYRLDADDVDLGRFFAMLALALDASGRRGRLPTFAPEHLAQPEAFARRWFRAAYTGLAGPAVLVFDNFEQAPLPALPAILVGAVGEAPAGLRLLVTSRHPPPAAFAAHAVAGRLALLPPDRLSFTDDEVEAYARALRLDPAAVRRAAARVQGWAAGLRLLGADAGAVSRDAAPQLLFDYFAGLLDDRLDPGQRDLLLVAALLPYVPAAVVDAVCGGDAAASLFETLCDQHLFTERVEGAPQTYRLHPLVVQFLRDRSGRRWSMPDRAQLLRAAAAAFAARGETDAAIDLALEAGDNAFAAGLVGAVIEARLAAGQLDQIAAWCARLGDDAMDAEPALRYGLARACFLREDPAALLHYARAADAFAARGDLAGEQLCAAGMLETAYNQDSFIGHARWSDRLRAPLPRPPDAPHHRLRLLNGRLLACYYTGDFVAEADVTIGQMLDLLVEPGAAAEKLCAAITLLGLLERHKRWDEAGLLADRMQALLDAPGVGPRLAILVRQQIAADLYRQTGAYDDARRVALAARAEAREQGFAVLEYEAVAILLLAALYCGDQTEARGRLAELTALGRPGNVYHQRFSSAMRSWHAAQGGRIAAAQAHAADLRAAVERSDMPPRFRATWLLQATLVRFMAGDEDGACAELRAAWAEAEPGSRATLQINLDALEALRAWRAGDGAMVAHRVAAAFAAAAPIRYHQLLAPMRAELATLAALALEQRIARDFAREMIHRRRLAPPSPANEHWPWLLRVRTFGSFAIEVDGSPLHFGAKTPRKPLALLKALVALGPQPVAEQVLADALWPDEEADAAHDALHVTLHRLRRLLPDGPALLPLHDGQLALDADRVWVDARAFEHLVQAAEHGGPGALDPLRAALRLYRGRFLAADLREPWAVAARERLHARCRRAVVACAQALTNAGRDEEALDVWRRGLETDELDEACTQGLMDCCVRLSRAAEGLTAYQRCRRVLSLAMGVAPSPTTERLAAALRALGESTPRDR